MSYHRLKTSRKPIAQHLMAAAAALLINVTLYLLVDALFAIDFTSAGGRMFS